MAIEILQKGDVSLLKNIRVFSYYACGCVFKADKTDYNIDSQYNEITYYCKCPTCNTTVTRSTDMNTHNGGTLR